jgi:uncharacterized repeat protein (TIGR01451 family)
MRPLVAAVLLSLSSLPLLAQNTDPSLSLVEVNPQESSQADRVSVGLLMRYRIEWSGIDPSRWDQYAIELDTPFFPFQIVDDQAILHCSESRPVRCTFDDDIRTTRGTVFVSFRAAQAGTFTSVFRLLTNGAPDANVANNVVSHAFEAVQKPVLGIRLDSSPGVVKPGQVFPFRLLVLNLGVMPATNIAFTLSLPAGGTLLSGLSSESATCGIASNVLTCTMSTLFGGYVQIEGSIQAPDRDSGEDLILEMTLTSAEEDFDPVDNHVTNHIAVRRQLVVTSTADDGGGSLRQAMLDANALCLEGAPCSIVFRIPAPVPQGGWFTIRPQTPLPALEGAVEIDGTSQTAFTGNTNVDGPEIEIAGEQLFNESGLRLLANCTMAVRGLAVNGFRGYGIYVRRTRERLPDGPCEGRDSGVAILDNYIGTDPTGRVAKPNHRGLGVFAFAPAIQGNLISGNTRSGIYAGGAFEVRITENRIGVASDGAPLGNGAGIMFDLDARPQLRVSADVTENVIAYNDMAIARTRAGEIFISGNRIFDNVQQAVDVDLDAASPNRNDDRDVPNRPVLFSATYDGARNVTIVRGHIESSALASSRYIELFASTRNSVWSLPQAERSVAFWELGNITEFELVIDGDQRGKWITAAFHARRFLDLGLDRTNTSELSDAVFVH